MSRLKYALRHWTVLAENDQARAEYKSGAALVRAAETHSDEAIDGTKFFLVELKK